MKLLQDYIQRYGIIPLPGVLKVDSFLNHQIDPILMMELAKDMQQHFQNTPITKILTIETSGIAPSVFLGYLLEVPVVYLKKSSSRITDGNAYCTSVHSFTKDIDYEIHCSKRYISADDQVLFIDDFMANGEACLGAINIIQQAQATLTGIGIVIEKAFQPGRQRVEDRGYHVYAQARIKSLDKGIITFLEEDVNNDK